MSTLPRAYSHRPHLAGSDPDPGLLDCTEAARSAVAILAPLARLLGRLAARQGRGDAAGINLSDGDLSETAGRGTAP